MLRKFYVALISSKSGVWTHKVKVPILVLILVLSFRTYCGNGCENKWRRTGFIHKAQVQLRWDYNPEPDNEKFEFEVTTNAGMNIGNLVSIEEESNYEMIENIPTPLVCLQEVVLQDFSWGCF